MSLRRCPRCGWPGTLDRTVGPYQRPTVSPDGARLMAALFSGGRP